MPPRTSVAADHRSAGAACSAAADIREARSVDVESGRDGPAVAGSTAEYRLSVPRWINAVDRAVIVLLNVMLAAEVLLMFASTMARTLFNSSALMGVDETSSLFLITLAFLGGCGRRTAAVSSSRSRAWWTARLPTGRHSSRRPPNGSSSSSRCCSAGTPFRFCSPMRGEDAFCSNISYLWMTCRSRWARCCSSCMRRGLASRSRAAIVTSLVAVGCAGGACSCCSRAQPKSTRPAPWGLAASSCRDRRWACRSDSCSQPSASCASRRQARPT